MAAFEKILDDIAPNDPFYGLSGGVTEENIQQQIKNTAQWRSAIEENDKTEIQRTYNTIIDRAHYDAGGSQELQHFTDTVWGNHPEITSKLLQEIAEPHLKQDSEWGGLISKSEFGQMVQALRDMIPALKDANTITVELKDG